VTSLEQPPGGGTIRGNLFVASRLQSAITGTTIPIGLKRCAAMLRCLLPKFSPR
jgi:hypothetical protein